MILITRPEDDAKKLSMILDEENIAHHIDSLISFSSLLKDNINLNGNIFLVSSVQAIYSMQKNNLFKNPDLASGSFYVIGNRSSQLLKELGMKQVGDTFADFNSFNNFFVNNKIENQINFLCGDIITQEAEEAVESKKLNKIILYKINAAKKFNKKTLEFFDEDKINSVFLFSKFTSSIYIKLLEHYNFEEKARGLKYYCLSSRIASFMQENGYNKCIISELPNQDSMVSTLKEI